MRRRLVVLVSLVMLIILAGCGGKGSDSDLGNLVLESSMDVRYAEGFSVDFYEGGYEHIRFSDGQQFLTVPEGAAVPDVKGVTILQKPLDNTYVAATAVMSLVASIDAIDNVKYSSLEQDKWYVEKAAEAMKNGNMEYAGKYSRPDYELLLLEECNLAIESTMITHSPDIKEKLEEVGIPVLMDLSSSEAGPLARLEWIKLYGVLFDKLPEAEKFFNAQEEKINTIDNEAKTDLTVAFFSINSQGLAVVRKSTDYVPEMIEIAGGNYIFSELVDETNSLSTVNMNMEEFYDTAVDADVLIYNSAIESELHSMDDLINLNEVFRDFKAVKSGNVWCTSKSMYQQIDAIADITGDMQAIFSGDEAKQKEMKYIRRLS